MHFKVSWGCFVINSGGGGGGGPGLLHWAIEIIRKMKKGYSNNLMLKKIPYHVMEELKRTPTCTLPAHPRYHL